MTDRSNGGSSIKDGQLEVMASTKKLQVSLRFIWATTSENRSSGFRTRSDTNWAGKSQKMARRSKFRILEEEGLYYPCSKNKGADQLCGYRTTGLRLCFCICKSPVSSRRGSFNYYSLLKMHSGKISSEKNARFIMA